MSILMRERSRYMPCPECGLSNNPILENNGDQKCLTCIVCKYSTGYNHIPSSLFIWNNTKLNKRSYSDPVQKAVDLYMTEWAEY